VATTYFGGCTSTGNPLGGTSTDTLSAFSTENDSTLSLVQCPGTGNFQLVQLGLYCKVASSAAHIRLAIYGPVDGTHNTNLVAQGSAALTVSSTSLGWVDHFAFTDASNNPITPNLVGGQKYRLMATADLSGCAFTFSANGANHYDATVRTTGWPATLAALPNNNGNEFVDIRVGVVQPVSITVTPTGNALSVAEGTPTVAAQRNITVSPTGVSFASRVGTPTVAVGQSVTVNLTGVSISSGVGTVQVQTGGVVVVQPPQPVAGWSRYERVRRDYVREREHEEITRSVLLSPVTPLRAKLRLGTARTLGGRGITAFATAMRLHSQLYPIGSAAASEVVHLSPLQLQMLLGHETAVTGGAVVMTDSLATLSGVGEPSIKAIRNPTDDELIHLIEKFL